MAKNLCGKSRPTEEPYEIWQLGDWEWRVLKKWQANDEQEFARWFCAVKSPFTYGGYELGDVYASEVMSSAVRVK
jgi:hypothetical protein